MSKMFACNMEFVREDDFVEYYLFPQLPENLKSIDRDSKADLGALRSYLNEFMIQCKGFVDSQCEKLNYIWHKDQFQLQVRIGTSHERLLTNETIKEEPEIWPPHLHGVTHYGDNIDDEWFIVKLLLMLTKNISGCIARVIDSDGEFLLIEAADVLPKWANPDTCEQRVYIVNGNIQLVQNSPSNTANLISVATAVTKIRENPTLYRVSKQIEKCINARLQEFSESNKTQHRQIARLPLGVAALLKIRPALISSAIRTFCERDVIDMKSYRAMRFFPPEQRVRTNVCFTRCLYAMIMQSTYMPDRKIGWNLSSVANTEQYKEDLLGVKIASGFEILASQAKDLVNEDNIPAWHSYIRNLTSKGYFRDNIEGSKEYKYLLTEAKTYFKLNNERFRTTHTIGKEILELLKNIDLNAEQLRYEENNLEPSESDDWLNIRPEQLDEMLTKRYGTKNIYDLNDINAEEFTKNITKFLEKQSPFDGVENTDNDDGHGYINTRTNEFKDEFRIKIKKNNSMRKACKQNLISDNKNPSKQTLEDDTNFVTHVRNFLDFVVPEDNWDSNSEMSDYEDEKDLERNFETMTNSGYHNVIDIESYMAQMDKELARTTIGQTFESKASRNTNESTTTTTEDDFDDIESFEPININVNTLKNMMDSYKFQIGGSGPVSNLLNAMGAGMSATTDNDDNSKNLSESTV